MIIILIPIVILAVAALLDALERWDKRQRLQRDEEELKKYLRGIK